MKDSYRILRKAIGYLGMFLPVIIVFGTMFFSDCPTFQPSISHYYYTNMGNVFVGFICSISLFLFSYKGYRYDHIFGKIACLLGFFTALFPTSLAEGIIPECHLRFPWYPEQVGNFHLASAALFLGILAFYSIVLFRKGDKSNERKKLRNRYYLICGIIMVVSMGIIVLVLALDKTCMLMKELHEQYHVVFWGETISLEAFGISWFIKGEGVKRLNDVPIRDTIW